MKKEIESQILTDDNIKDILKKGTEKASRDCDEVVKRVEKAMKIDYYE